MINVWKNHTKSPFKQTFDFLKQAIKGTRMLYLNNAIINKS